jgi:hypothetical protein
MIDEFCDVLKNKIELQQCRFDSSKALNYSSVPEYWSPITGKLASDCDYLKTI